MIAAGAVLVAPDEDEQEELRLWDGLATPLAAPARAPAPERAPDPRHDRLTERTAPVGPARLEVPPTPTLEDLVAGAWDGLVTGVPTACPVCTEPMRPRWSAGAGVVGGHCESCGTGVG